MWMQQEWLYTYLECVDDMLLQCWITNYDGGVVANGGGGGGGSKDGCNGCGGVIIIAASAAYATTATILKQNLNTCTRY